MNVKRILAFLLTAIMLISCLSACGDKEQSAASGSVEEAQDSSELKVANLGSTGYWCNEVMDPAAGDTYNGWYIGYYGITQQLFKLSENFVPECWLAESYKQVDDTTWEFTLRDNVYFHNGEKMTAQSVVNCFERTISINSRAEAAAEDWIDSMEADGQVLTIHTKRVVSTIANELSDPLWVVYYADKEVDYEDGNSYYTGPYVLKSFSPFDETVVVKNENYWGDEPKLDEIHFITVSDDTAAVMAMENGEIDMIYPVYAGAVGSLEGKDNVVIDGVTSSRGQFLEFNLKSATTGDLNVRTAISMCVDREGYAENICNNTVVPSYGIYGENIPFGGTDGLNLTVTKTDAEGAAALLKEAGYTDSNNNGILDKDGVELEIKLVVRNADADMVSMCEDLQSRLDTIGVKLNIVTMDATADTLAAGDYDIGCVSYAMAPTGTADYFMNLKFRSESAQNYGGFSDSKVDELIKEIAVTTDPDAVNTMAFEVEQAVIDQCAYVFFAHSKYLVAYSDRIQDFNNNPTEYYCVDEYLDVTA